MSWIFVIFLGGSLIYALTAENTALLAPALLEGAQAGITLAISLAGPICLWSGLCHVMEAVGWMDSLSKMLTPLLRRLFPRAWENRETRQAICGNLAANLLGLGNAATPLGIRAAVQMADGDTAGNELCRLVIMNTASVQLIPATVAAVRSSMGAVSPFDILPAVWISSLLSVTMGLLAARLLSKWPG